MEICIRKEPNGTIYIDKTVLQRLSKEELQKEPYNFYFTNVEKEDCEPSDFNNNFQFDINKYNERKQQEEIKNEYNEILIWFEKYDNQVKQYSRCQRLGIEFDKDITELDKEAKINAERISEIRNVLKDLI